MVPAGFEREVLAWLAPRVAGLVARAVSSLPQPLEEIRLREGRPLHLVLSGADRFVTPEGGLTADPARADRPGREDLARTFQLIARGSVYAWEDEVAGGFLTLPGGHRVGLCGRAVTEAGRMRTLKHVASLNLRIARDVPGAAGALLPGLICGKCVASTLIISPPQAGKTTVLRDLVRQISAGVPGLGLSGCKVGLVDERSEVAGSVDGVPQRDLGPRTDVLDGAPKAQGMMLLIRAMSPQVLAVDEIGRREDAEAVLEALHAGVAVLATAHGQDLADVSRRPALAELLAAGAFRRAAVLSRRRGPGTLEQVLEIGPGGAGAAVGLRAATGRVLA